MIKLLQHNGAIFATFAIWLKLCHFWKLSYSLVTNVLTLAITTKFAFETALKLGKKSDIAMSLLLLAMLIYKLQAFTRKYLGGGDHNTVRSEYLEPATCAEQLAHSSRAIDSQ